MKKAFMLCLLLLWTATLAPLAQEAEEDLPFAGAIAFDTPVSDSITDRAVYDWWSIRLRAGDTVRVRLQAYDGLIPLIGIMDSERNLVARSDETITAEADGLLEYDFRAPADDEFTIIVTRDGNATGTTTGRYVLDASLIGRVIERENTRPEVQFRCNEVMVTSTLFLTLADTPRANDPNGVVEEYAIYVYGLDDFVPFLRVTADISDEVLNCTGDAGGMLGTEWRIPNEPPAIVEEEDRLTRAILRNLDREQTFGTVRVTVGSREGGKGRFVVVVQGLQIAPRGDSDRMEVRLAPLNRQTGVTVYAVGNPNTRLDPMLSVIRPNGEPMVCDDAGGRDCPHVPAFTGYGLIVGDSPELRFLGRRFDAGAILQPMTTDPQILDIQARNHATEGAYTLYFFGELR